MMVVKAYKYQGAGNDFVIIDNRKGDVSLTSAQIKLLCDRRFGIGSDGLMYLGKSEKYDFSMTYYNSDGNEGTMCGNGGRCLVAFAAHRGLKSYRFGAIDGEHIAKVINYSSTTCFVELGMIDVTSIREHSPKSFILNTGSPHMVNFVDNLKEYDVIGQGKLWRHHTMFPEGTNVNFVQGSWGKDSSGWSSIFDQRNALELSVRTFERGVEDETLACGTGITASAIAYHHLLSKSFRNRPFNSELCPANIRSKVKALGGDLEVTFRYMGGERYTDIILKGNASFVFKCDFEI